MVVGVVEGILKENLLINFYNGKICVIGCRGKARSYLDPCLLLTFSSVYYYQPCQWEKYVSFSCPISSNKQFNIGK